MLQYLDGQNEQRNHNLQIELGRKRTLRDRISICYREMDPFIANPACARVFSLPELLEQILYHYGQFQDFEDINDGFTSFYKLRGVSKFWKSLIDTSPALLSFTFRNPRVRHTPISRPAPTEYSDSDAAKSPTTDAASNAVFEAYSTYLIGRGYEDWTINKAFLRWFRQNFEVRSISRVIRPEFTFGMDYINAFAQATSFGVDLVKELEAEAALSSLSSSPPPLLTEDVVGDIRINFPDVYLTQPVLQQVALHWSFYGDEDWMKGFREYRKRDAEERPRSKETASIPRAYWVWRQYVIENPSGIRTSDILSNLIKLLLRFYTFSGAFKLYEIVLRFGIGEEEGNAPSSEDDDALSTLTLEDCEREYILWPL